MWFAFAPRGYMSFTTLPAFYYNHLRALNYNNKSRFYILFCFFFGEYKIKFMVNLSRHTFVMVCLLPLRPFPPPLCIYFYFWRIFLLPILSVPIRTAMWLRIEILFWIVKCCLCEHRCGHKERTFFFIQRLSQFAHMLAGCPAPRQTSSLPSSGFSCCFSQFLCFAQQFFLFVCCFMPFMFKHHSE